ncbi:hypothetical protein GUJ93_ZPchr0008g13282 [Zizania palustris]|uniref:Uncharacterized protein n=1 Tax=Zizania palustris TaxID=103762 RepID=A0A8J5UWZ1_ZIZPA|nr:hypothetical protein GUJ93_ZPchr0008g13282 [Zizania palustris]
MLPLLSFPHATAALRLTTSPRSVATVHSPVAPAIVAMMEAATEEAGNPSCVAPHARCSLHSPPPQNVRTKAIYVTTLDGGCALSGGSRHSAEVVTGSTVWIGKGFSCTYAQRRNNDMFLSFDLMPI